MKVRLDLAYDGSAFFGWARQPEHRSVQETLETALATVLRRPVKLTVAGRTDAGVHASGQVVSLELDQLPDLRRLNGILPDDVVITAATEVPRTFDARYAATGRAYTYRLTDGIPEPLRRYDTVAWSRPLEVALMTRAAQPLLGEHDFAAYCRKREGATTVRRLSRLELVRDGSVITAHLEADAFCHSMVRAIIGALLCVGDGRRPVSLPRDVLEAGVRDPRVTVAPPHGLTLVRVDFPEGAAALAARQVASRRLRIPLRLATLSDVPAILALADEAVEWLVARGITDQWGTTAPSAGTEWPDRLLAGIGAGEIRVAVSGADVLGVLRVGPAPPYVPAALEPERYVRLLLTSRSRAPWGLGPELLQRVCEEAVASGVGLVRLDCYRSPDRKLISVYERSGFRATEEFTVGELPGQVLERRV